MNYCAAQCQWYDLAMVLVHNDFGCNRVSGCALLVSGGEMSEGGNPSNRRASGVVRNPKVDNAPQSRERVTPRQRRRWEMPTRTIKAESIA